MKYDRFGMNHHSSLQAVLCHEEGQRNNLLNDQCFDHDMTQITFILSPYSTCFDRASTTKAGDLPANTHTIVICYHTREGEPTGAFLHKADSEAAPRAPAMSLTITCQRLSTHRTHTMRWISLLVLLWDEG